MRVTGFKTDLIILDLVAHFLGIAPHDNVNAAPSALSFPQKSVWNMQVRPVAAEHPPKASGY